MAKRWSVSTLAALALLCCFAGKEVESQGIGGSKGGPPQDPQYPQPPTPPKLPPQYPQPPTPPKLPPQYPQPPTPPKLPPQAPPKPQYPQPPTPPKLPPQAPPTPPKLPPQAPPTLPKLPPQAPPKPQYPQPQPQSPQGPSKPQYPRPKVTPKPQDPSLVTPPKPQSPKLSFDYASQGPVGQYPSGPGGQYPSGPGGQYPSGPGGQYPSGPGPQYPSGPGPQYPSGPGPQYPSGPGPQYPKPAPQPVLPPGPQYPKPHDPKKTPWAYDQAAQEPKIPPQKPQTQIPSTPPVKSCDVDRQVRVPCGVHGISAQECDAIDCCYDGQQCYFGKTVTVQCTKDAHFIVVVARDVTLPNIDLDTISLLGQGQGCAHVDSNSAFAIYHFPVTACGSVVLEEPGVIIYENRMVSSYEVAVGSLGIITRDSHYEVLFQCRYIGTSVETVLAEVLPLDNPPLPVADFGPIHVHLRLANGECLSKGCNEVDAAYTSYFLDTDYPVTKVLREPVYVEVLLLGKSDPTLELTLGRCWATTSRNAHSLPQWDILIDGCPYRDDRYLSALVPVGPSSGLEFPSHYKRFLFKMFTFVDPSSMEPLREKIYIHCSTAVCVPGQGVSCEPSCFTKGKRDTTAAEAAEAAEQAVVEPKVVVSSEEVVMVAPEE